LESFIGLPLLFLAPSAVVLLDYRHGVAEERRHLADRHSLTQQVARERVTETMRVPIHFSRIVHDSRIPEQLQKTPLPIGDRRLQFSVAGPEPSESKPSVRIQTADFALYCISDPQATKA
jgi:hypothetical protein